MARLRWVPVRAWLEQSRLLQRWFVSRSARQAFRWGLVALCSGASLTAGAQTWPDRPIRFILPSSVGGNADIVARLLAEAMARSLGQSLVVDNRGGANGIIGTVAAAKAVPDGYTIMMGSSTQSISSALFNDLPYDLLRDFATVGMVGAIPVLLVINPKVPANNLRELIAYAKANPNKLNFASTGNGSPAHLAGELFNSMAGIKTMHVPYKGTSQGTTDAIGGSIQIAWPSVSSTLQFVREGKLRVVGISSLQRSAIASDIPPIADVLPGYQASIWNGVFAPAGTPAAIVTRLNAELNKALDSPEVKNKLLGMGFDPDPGTPQALRAFIDEELKKWRGVVKDAGIKVEAGR